MCALALAWCAGSASSAEPVRLPEDAPPGQAAEGAKGPDDEGRGPETWRRDGLSLIRGDSRIQLTGYVQEDLRYFDWAIEGDRAGAGRSPGHELRRLRMGTKAWFGKVALVFAIDPRDSKKGDRLKDVTAAYTFSEHAVLLSGYFKPSIGQEFLTSSSKTDFVERNMAAASLSPDRDWGAELGGSFRHVGYALGVFAGDGNSSYGSASTSLAGRAILKPSKALELAGSFMQGQVRAGATTGSVRPAPKGARGESASGFAFWPRSSAEGTRRRWGGDLTYSRGPFKVQAEYLELREERQHQGAEGLDLPETLGRGWNIQLSHVVTGEAKGATVSPKRSVFNGGRGALELVARAESLRFDGFRVASGSPSSTAPGPDLRRAGARAVQAGANYWFSSFMKVQGSALWETYDDPAMAPTPGRKGRYFTLMARLQLMIP